MNSIENENNAAITEDLMMMDRRHVKEMAELEDKMRHLLRGAKKSEKAVVEAKAIQMLFDLKARHREEVDSLEEIMEAKGEALSPASAGMSSVKNENPIEDNNDDNNNNKSIEKKREKAKKKKEKLAVKEQMKQATKERIMESAGLSLREIELEAINSRLAMKHLTIKDIPSDGNCLYRAIADQINSQSEGSNIDFVAVRRMAATYMRANEENFAPFIEAEMGSFEHYCRKVENADDGEWGGELEIRAISASLKRRIIVYSAEVPELVMGLEYEDGSMNIEDRTDRAIVLSFHRHYFALGEHYNSVRPLQLSMS